ncbi:MAG: hypothetical protein M1581_05130 [Candidatus Thermoplasmatota archaeon]|nr:hypothetical protein [Candidatus Thermoplasmatota archaeon]
MTKIPIIDLAKDGAMYYVGFIFDNTRRQVIAYPRYEDILSAVKIAETQLDLKAIPLHELKDTDPHNTVYYTDSISSLCTSNRINEIQEKIQARGSKFTSKIHAEYHPDPEMMGKADHRCPYTIQNENYHGLMTRDFFILITTISKAAYIPRTLYAKNIHLALNEAYYKRGEDGQNDFITNPTYMKRPEELSRVMWSQPVNGYWQVFSDKLPFRWFKEIDENIIELPSTLEELLLNLLNLGLNQDEKIQIYSRDAFLSHSYLPQVDGFEYIDGPIFEHIPSFNYLPNFKISNTKMERLNLLEQLLVFKKINKLVRFVADQSEGEIALLLNEGLNFFFKTLKNYRSGEMQNIINLSLGHVKDSQRLDFINVINQGRKRKFADDIPISDLVYAVMTDYYVNYLSKEPWNRTTIMNSKDAFYSSDFFPNAIILFGTNFQLFQAIQLISGGKKLNYHSLKGGGITFKDKELERSICRIYVKALKSLSNVITVGNVYVADPTFNYWSKTYLDLFDQLSTESINLDQKSFD